MRDWIRQALARIDLGRPLILVTVVGAEGSAPREPGAKMLVSEDGVAGTIGGGALEHVCIDQARKLLQRDDVRAAAQDYPLGPLLGQCCGGRVRLALERLDGADRDWLEAAGRFEAGRRDYALVMRRDGGGRRACDGWPAGQDRAGILLCDAEGAVLAPRDQGGWVSRVELVRPLARRVLLVGGGHVGAALAGFLAALPLDLDWIDPRPGADGRGHGGARLAADCVAEVARAAPGGAFVIATHSHALDYDLCRAALARDDALYCGVIGSRTKRQRFLGRLAAAGLGEAQLDRLVCPIGAIGLSGKEPPVIALAVAAELLLAFERAEAAK